MRCRIRIKGHLDLSWQEWMGLELVHDASGTTVLCGTLRDQAALYGVLLKIHRLNVPLLSLETVEALQEEFPFYWTLTLPLINQGGSWFSERACHIVLTDSAVVVHFPQAFTGLAPRLFPSAPRYSMFLASSDRQSDREVGIRPPRRSYAAYHHFAYEQFDTLVLLPVGTIYHGTQRNTIRLSVCKRTRTSILQEARNVKRNGMGNGFSACGRQAFHPSLGKTGAFKPVLCKNGRKGVYYGNH